MDIIKVISTESSGISCPEQKSQKKIRQKINEKLKRICKIVLHLLLVSFLAGSCTSKKIDTIELKLNKYEKLNLNSTSQIIKLETNPESLIQYIFKTQIDLSNDRIFVLSNFNIYFFDASGKYLSKLKIGKGPSEILQIVAFTVDVERKLIYAIDNSRYLCTFNYLGNMINRYNIENFASTDVSILDDENVLLLRNFVGAEENYFVGIYDLAAQEVVKKFVASDESPYSKCSIATLKNFSQNNGKHYLNIPNIFSLFEFKDKESGFQPVFAFDIGELAVPKNLSSKFENGNFWKLRDEAKSLNYAPYQLFSFKFKEYFFIGIDDENINCYAINSRNQKIYHNGALSLYYNLPDKQSLKLPAGIQNNQIIFQCSPSDFFNIKTQMDTMEINIDSNKFIINRMDNPFLIVIE